MSHSRKQPPTHTGSKPESPGQADDEHNRGPIVQGYIFRAAIWVVLVLLFIAMVMVIAAAM